MTRRRMLSLAALTLLLAGCGTSLPAPSPSATPPPHIGNVLTAADNGVTITLAIGQQLTIDLAPGSGAYAWDRPQQTGSSLQLVSIAGGYPSRSPMRAVFLAVSPGVAVVSTVSDMPCLHARPRCLVAQRVWRARVIVRPGS